GPGRIYAQVRRSQTGFFESFIVALDARTGRLLWRRHLASAAIGRGGDNMPFARMSAHRGQLYVVDHMGTVASLDGRTGAVNWLALVDDNAATLDARVAIQMS